jgi:hypothetical protein
MTKRDSKKRISYVKPEALDVGSVASIMGASCVFGDGVENGTCQSTGNAATKVCLNGNVGKIPN